MNLGPDSRVWLSFSDASQTLINRTDNREEKDWRIQKGPEKKLVFLPFWVQQLGFWFWKLMNCLERVSITIRTGKMCVQFPLDSLLEFGFWEFCNAKNDPKSNLIWSFDSRYFSWKKGFQDSLLLLSNSKALEGYSVSSFRRHFWTRLSLRPNDQASTSRRTLDSGYIGELELSLLGFAWKRALDSLLAIFPLQV